MNTLTEKDHRQNEIDFITNMVIYLTHKRDLLQKIYNEKFTDNGTKTAESNQNATEANTGTQDGI